MAGSIDLEYRLQTHNLQLVKTPIGQIQYRHAGAGLAKTTHVLLHGIGSGSASWVMQLEAVKNSKECGVLAWEAPGYGNSTNIDQLEPIAQDYANRLWDWLDTLGIKQPINLVGHSLGALMAASAANLQAKRVSRLILLAPAQGYGLADKTIRDQKRNDRLLTLNTLGPQGIAIKRGPAMLSNNATPQQLTFIQKIMSQVLPKGYTQATYMLAQGDIFTDIKNAGVPVTIASGRADTITPMTNCQNLATQLGLPWNDLGDVGHACAIEASEAVNTLLGLNVRCP